jgi:hypothetical protein
MTSVLDVVDAVSHQRPCPCACHATLTERERVLGIAAVYACDDALRGFGYQPVYDLHGDALWREAQKKNDPEYRMVAVRFGECIYRRLLGSLLHECLHACFGDPPKANYGIPFGLPYGVPHEIAPSEEEKYLDRFNFDEARAFVGVWIVGKRLFDVDWDVRTARDVGTYGFTGGNALVPVPRGFRPVAHIDRTHHEARYYARARRLEDRARAWLADEANLGEVLEKLRSAAAVGERTRRRPYPDPARVGRSAPSKIGRNEPCVCGSNVKFKDCCGAAGALRTLPTTLAR